MGLLGCGLALLATLFMLIGLIPLLGWVNWITSLPLAIAATVAFHLALREPPRSAFAQVGLVLSIIVLCIAAFRLVLGGGLV